MKKILAEIHRRSLWQVLGIYLAASWVAIQVVNEIGDAVGLPEWVSGGAVVLLVIGFPIVLATAFIQHGPSGAGAGPAGAEARSEVPDPAVPSGAAPEARVEEARGSIETSPGAAASAHAGRAVESGSRAERPSGHRRLFTWRNAILGGVAAFLLFGLGTGIWMTLRALGIGPAGTLVARGALEERALVILADFQGEDHALAEAATQALRVDLSQSEVIRLAEPATVQGALERMGRDPSETLTPELASELAVREGAGAVISGEINPAGTGQVFSAQVVSVADGSVLTSQRESAADEADVIPAIDRLSRKLRERIGDSFRDIRSDPPLERVTTSNLEALKLYSRAAEEDGVDPVVLLEEAVALDPGFAMAWRALGVRYQNRRVERAKMIDAFTRAFEARDRLTERERHKVASIYYTVVEFDHERARAEYEALLELDPDDVSTIVNLGVLASSVGDHERSAGFARRAMELDPEGEGPAYWNAVTSLVNTGRLAEAEAIVDSAEKVWGNSAPRMRLMVQAARGELDEAEATFRGLAEREDLPPRWRAQMALNLAAFAAAHGRVAEAGEETRIRTSFLADEGDGPEYLEAVAQAAWTDLAVRERPDEALARLEEALDRFPLAELAPLDRPYLELAEAFARAGRPQRARELVEDMRSSVDEAGLTRARADLRRVEGEIALAESGPEDALERFRRADRDFCHICRFPGMARAYEALGQRDSAIAMHERYVETPYSDRFLPYTYRQGQALGPTYERLGELHDAAGNPEDAARYYAIFVELWAEADEELQPRVRAAQARLEEIMRERG